MPLSTPVAWGFAYCVSTAAAQSVHRKSFSISINLKVYHLYFGFSVVALVTIRAYMIVRLWGSLLAHLYLHQTSSASS